MKKLYIIILVSLVIIGGIYMLIKKDKTVTQTTQTTQNGPVKIIPISHATAVINWGDKNIYTDSVGGAEVFTDQASPDIILLTDIHGDHLNVDTLIKVLGRAILITPQAVKDLLPADLALKAQVMKNGETKTFGGFTITAIPMYNLPESKDAFHTKGRGNGYVVEKDGFQVYIAGDTSGTLEMRALKNIDIALVPMNLPYTMSVEEAANAVLEFKPKQVWPYHYRGPGGLSDVQHFKDLINAGDPNIEVILGKWY
ncbi:MAG: MBL fold metallo-hydrolase [Minisyncoccia bacterium]